jgi:hypothetical protein
MSVVARFKLPAHTFELGRALDFEEVTELRLEAVVPTGEESIPYLWISGGDPDRIADELGTSPLVARATVDHTSDKGALIRVSWTRCPELVDLINQHDGIILEAAYLGSVWSFRLRFPDRPDVSQFHGDCRRLELPVALVELHHSAAAVTDGGYGLTAEQREALVLAIEGDYFDVPRGTTLRGIAADLGVSDSAASQRIRRGLRNLLSSAPLSYPDSVDGEQEAAVAGGEAIEEATE